MDLTHFPGIVHIKKPLAIRYCWSLERKCLCASLSRTGANTVSVMPLGREGVLKLRNSYCFCAWEHYLNHVIYDGRHYYLFDTTCTVTEIFALRTYTVVLFWIQGYLSELYQPVKHANLPNNVPSRSRNFTSLSIASGDNSTTSGLILGNTFSVSVTLMPILLNEFIHLAL